ncbi:EF-hand domain-containing protein [Orrella daihaiensis]|uniref:EF-hand domain-containing protein n=1 Tax=Orrella daihaiensis TaxID=2782176 RepID=A0ABY4AJ38_9BURK|nr:EF-hand domain-containing protein [Orrella daihaiensis]UOD50093.1 EF-hand domain-containing protein [Orrella daihaiensis]
MTNPLIAISSAVILASTVPLAALAQSNANLPATPANDAEVAARFKAADKNGDGKVTKEEAEASLPRVALAWEKIDIDKKGYITLEQLQLIAANNR